MKKVNIHNYEAFLLDYLEGNLDRDTTSELKEFLAAHPELENELEGMEDIQLRPESVVFDREGLKAPSKKTLRSDEEARDELYFKAVEGRLAPWEEEALKDLLSDERFKKEYRLWQMIRLEPGHDEMDRSGLYRLPLELPIHSESVEYFLIARSEGILSDEESAALEKYCLDSKELQRELRLADALRLEAPKGVFYPDKNGLKKKRKGVLVFMYRAAAVIIILGLIGSLTLLLPEEEPSINGIAESSTALTDSLRSEDESKEERLEDTIPKMEKMPSIPLEEWEQLEPDPVEYALEENLDDQKPLKKSVERNQVSVEPVDVLFAEIKLPETQKGILTPDEGKKSVQPRKSAQPEFLTIGELAERRLANELELSESERDEVALSIAKRITEKAGEALDTEIKKQEHPETDQLTYSLRIGSLKISRTTAK